MKSYSATMIVSGFNTGAPMAGCGSFRNISIDGRLSFENAVEVARETFKREAQANGVNEYQGFAIEKTERFVNYKNPIIIDSNLKAKEIGFLL